jgi:putative transposase
MMFRPELLDELLKGYENPEDLLGNGGILKQLTAALVERCLNAEMKTHLDEQKVEAEGEDKPARNRRNVIAKRPLKGSLGRLKSVSPVTATLNLNPRSSRRDRPDSTALTTKSCPSMPGA